jgi:hypothetical protein
MSERESELEAELAKARAETRDAFVNRALMTAHIFDVLEEELGTERAVELMKRAIYRRGLEIAERYRTAVEARDLAEVGRLFVEGSASCGSIFEPSVEELEPDGGRVVLRMNACVHKDAWREAGYSPERVDLLCDIASAVDFGTFEGAGLSLRFLDRQACPGSDRCLLELRLGEKG